MLPYTVSVDSFEQQRGQAFPIPRKVALFLEAKVSSGMAREATAGSYYDRITVDVDY